MATDNCQLQNHLPFAAKRRSKVRMQTAGCASPSSRSPRSCHVLQDSASKGPHRSPWPLLRSLAQDCCWLMRCVVLQQIIKCLPCRIFHTSHKSCPAVLSGCPKMCPALSSLFLAVIKLAKPRRIGVTSCRCNWIYPKEPIRGTGKIIIS